MKSSFKLSTGSGKPFGLGGKLFGTAFLLVFLGMGLLFTGFMLREAWRNWQSYGWARTDCEIQKSEIEDKGSGRGNRFQVRIAYNYSVDGRSYVSDQISRNQPGFSDYGKAQRLQMRLSPGTRMVCFVDPSAPAVAVLEHGSFWFLLMLPLPLLFVAIGGGGIFLLWKATKPERSDDRTDSISEKVSAGRGQWFLTIFFSFFLLIGLAVSYPLVVSPVFSILAARNWTSVPCVVVSSDVRRHSDSDGTTYSVDILYSYKVNGREFKSNRYQFMSGSSSGYQGKAAVVGRFPPGAEAECYVNPEDPTDSVLERGWTNGLWFGLIPLVFVLIGFTGLVFSIRSKKNGFIKERRGPAPFVLGSVESPVNSQAESLTLAPASSPRAMFFFILLFSLFWNGIISVFVVNACKGWSKGHADWFLTLFLVPFVLIGLGLICFAFYLLLASFNPRPTLTITPGAVQLNGTFRLCWRLSGRTRVIRQLRIALEGREEATYRQGTSTSTDRHVFANVLVLDTADVELIGGGETTVIVPKNSMHSFAAPNNKVIWTLHVHGDIARWPDINIEFPITVLPVWEAKR